GGEAGLVLEGAAARELFAGTRTLPPDHLTCVAKIASAITPKAAKATQEEPLVCTRIPVCGVRICTGCACTPSGKFTSTCVSILRPASVSICETIQRASCRLLISSASVNFLPLFVSS